MYFHPLHYRLIINSIIVKIVGTTESLKRIAALGPFLYGPTGSIISGIINLAAIASLIDS